MSFRLRTGHVLLGFIFLFTLFGPYLAGQSPYQQNLALPLLAPGHEYWLGTDHLGRSLYSRLAVGARYSLFIACSVVVISCVSGSLLGVAAGYRGGWFDTAIMRIVDLALAVPGILPAIILAGLLGGSILTLVIALSVNLWCDYCRLARNMTRTIKYSSHMEAGKLLGFNDFFLARKYIIPEIIPQMTILAALGMGKTVLNVSGLGFLGIGLRPPRPEWGGMISEGIPYLGEAPWLVMIPGFMVFITVLGFQLISGSSETNRKQQ